MKCKSVVYKFNNEWLNRVDLKYSFASKFNSKTGFYLRTNVIKDGVETKEEPFMASFPHLIDVGVMGHCVHGKTGLCVKAGIECYQSGLHINKPNMKVEDFEKIATECEGLIDQIALGGRGDPDCHEEFETLLKICKNHHIVPNYTTSGLLMNEEKARLTKEYCGAVAVSWYRSDYTYKAIDLFLKAGVKTNIHYVVDNNSIDEAINRLNTNDFPKGINAIVFLLFKPVGQGQQRNKLIINDPRIKEFFDAVAKKHPFKIGFDSCFVPGVINNMKNVDLNTVDTCEGARYSMYISSDMVAVPCSFDQSQKYAFDIKEKDINDAWNSKEFEEFRKSLRYSCPSCNKRSYCMGGCPLVKDIVLCELKEDILQEN